MLIIYCILHCLDGQEVLTDDLQANLLSLELKEAIVEVLTQ
jgi:hypothetical protein